MPMSLDEVRRLLTPSRLAFITETVLGAIGDYDNPRLYSPEARRDHTPSIKAAIRNGHMIGRAVRAAAFTHDIRIHKKGNRITFIIADQVRLLFKRLDRNLRSRNYPTQRALDILDQKRPPLDIDLPPDLTNVIAGYVSDPAEVTFEMYVTCPQGSTNAWTLKLTGADITVLTPPVAQPQPKSPPTRRVLPRRDPTHRKQLDGTREQP